MNTIPSIFDSHQINRTVIGGKENESPDALNISVILLNNSGNHFNLQMYENLLACNFKSIICVERRTENFSTDDVVKKFSAIKFIIPSEPATDGDMINLAMSEIKSDYVLVLKDSLYIPSGLVSPNLAQRLIQEDIFCVVPRLMDKNKNGLSTRFTPGAEKSHFVIDSSFVVTDGVKTLYPLDNIALYNRKKFIKIGGFDYTIQSPYWQSLDLAIRSWLYGEKTKLTTLLQLNYVDEVPVEDRTINIDYIRYHLKNELPRFKNEKAYIRKSQFLKFYMHSSCGFFEARRQFSEAVKWIDINKYFFKMDLQGFIESWSK